MNLEMYTVSTIEIAVLNFNCRCWIPASMSLIISSDSKIEYPLALLCWIATASIQLPALQGLLGSAIGRCVAVEWDNSLRFNALAFISEVHGVADFLARRWMCLLWEERTHTDLRLKWNIILWKRTYESSRTLWMSLLPAKAFWPAEKKWLDW